MEGRDRESFEGGSEPRGFSNWEKHCIEQLESQPEVDERLAVEKEQALQRLWNAFQNAATACAQLYKGRHDYDFTAFQSTAFSFFLYSLIDHCMCVLRHFMFALLLVERHHHRNQACDRLWSPFQDTANTVTLLYKGKQPSLCCIMTKSLTNQIFVFGKQSNEVTWLKPASSYATRIGKKSYVFHFLKDVSVFFC